MLKIYGKEFAGDFFKNWNLKSNLRVNLIERVRNRFRGADLSKRCVVALGENEVELLKLKEHLQSVIKEKKDAIQNAQFELSDIEESLKIVDEAVNVILLGTAWNIGYNAAEEDLKPKRNVKTT